MLHLLHLQLSLGTPTVGEVPGWDCKVGAVFLHTSAGEGINTAFVQQTGHQPLKFQHKTSPKCFVTTPAWNRFCGFNYHIIHANLPLTLFSLLSSGERYPAEGIWLNHPGAGQQPLPPDQTSTGTYKSPLHAFQIWWHG